MVLFIFLVKTHLIAIIVVFNIVYVDNKKVNLKAWKGRCKLKFLKRSDEVEDY
jgi:hypothetical protein